METHCILGIWVAGGEEEKRRKLEEVNSSVDTPPTQSKETVEAEGDGHCPERWATWKCWEMLPLRAELRRWRMAGRQTHRRTRPGRGGCVPAKFGALDLIFQGDGHPQTPRVGLGHALITLLSVPSHLMIQLELRAGKKKKALVFCSGFRAKCSQPIKMKNSPTKLSKYVLQRLILSIFHTDFQSSSR